MYKFALTQYFDIIYNISGENGKAVNINKTLLNAEDRAEYDAGWKNNAFNEFLSKRISLDRTLADPRDEK